MSKVSKFWVVTKPNKNLELIDIFFQADIKRMELQFKGDLASKGIIGIFTTGNEAEKVAKMALLKAGAIKKF
ncbi:MAG: hypothetical protein HUU48_09010 [Flavobacteriales bacterium]|nr:hypothetical protein [Flavobacteriales bacterium]